MEGAVAAYGNQRRVLVEVKLIGVDKGVESFLSRHHFKGDLRLYESSLYVGSNIVLVPRIRVVYNTYRLVVNDPSHLQWFRLFEKLCLLDFSNHFPVDLAWVSFDL